MSGIILLSSKGKAPGLLRIRLATASLLAMTGEKTFYETVKHYSISTEEAYIGWMVPYAHFHNKGIQGIWGFRR